MTLALVERGLIEKFMGIWSSHILMGIWVEKNWMVLIKGKLSCYFYNKYFYAFLFEPKEDHDLIFCNGPYFFGTRGMYLNCWTLSFDLELEVPCIVLVQVRLSHLPLHC
jgi:hypothetical protein